MQTETCNGSANIQVLWLLFSLSLWAVGELLLSSIFTFSRESDDGWDM